MKLNPKNRRESKAPEGRRLALRNLRLMNGWGVPWGDSSGIMFVFLRELAYCPFPGLVNNYASPSGFRAWCFMALMVLPPRL